MDDYIPSNKLERYTSIVAIFTVMGALLGATDLVAKIEPKIKLTICALVSSTALFAVLRIQAFPYWSILVSICDGLAVLTMATTRTKVQLFAKEHYADYLSSIIASRGLVIKGATLHRGQKCLKHRFLNWGQAKRDRSAAK